MVRFYLIAMMIPFFWGNIFLSFNGSSSAEANDGPIMHIDKMTHTFPTVFEGRTLSHTFLVFNKGKANLNIKKITHS